MRAVDYVRKKLQRLLFPGLDSSVKRLEKQVAKDSADRATFAERIQRLEASNKKLTGEGQKGVQRLTALSDLLGTLYMSKHARDVGSMTSQERAWFGKHGFRYIVHHLEEDWEQTRIPFWTMALSLVPEAESFCEFGANIGSNLKAIRKIRPMASIHAVEVNPIACEILRAEKFLATSASISQVELGEKYDFVFSRGVLIHVKPSELQAAMRRMAEHSSRYVMIFEHYSDTMESLQGYGEVVAKTTGEPSEGYQFWSDFSGEFAKLYPKWVIVRSGVQTKLDARPKHGDLHWTIFRRPV